VLYRSKLFMLKSAARIAREFPGITRRFTASPNYPRDKVGAINETEIRAAHIRRYTPGKTFLDAGCMYRTNGAYVFYAERCGATRSCGMDVIPASEAFIEHKLAIGSAAEFIHGDINSKETMENIGETDVVFCNGVLYHTPDPFLMLTRLREICRETLLLYTATIPERRGMQNMAIFYPFLSDGQRSMWNPMDGGYRPSLTEPYDPEAGYGNWFWGMTPSCVASLALCAGFAIESIVKHRPFATMLVCRVRGEKPRSALDPAIYQRPVAPLART